VFDRKAALVKKKNRINPSSKRANNDPAYEKVTLQGLPQSRAKRGRQVGTRKILLKGSDDNQDREAGGTTDATTKTRTGWRSRQGINKKGTTMGENDIRTRKEKIRGVEFKW